MISPVVAPIDAPSKAPQRTGSGLPLRMTAAICSPIADMTSQPAFYMVLSPSQNLLDLQCQLPQSRRSIPALAAPEAEDRNQATIVPNEEGASKGVPQTNEGVAIHCHPDSGQWTIVNNESCELVVRGPLLIGRFQ